jgi:4-hydroxythreonine-4-phosphate dehydrogenase
VTHIARIVITPGEPAGIGPDITLKIAQEKWSAELIAVCDPDLLIARAKILNLPLTLQEFDPIQSPTPHQPGVLKIYPLKSNIPSQAGLLDSNNATYVLHCLELATDYCLNGTADALVTGPVHKSIINEAGIEFTGHTEFLAKHCHAEEVIMLFVAGDIKVALVTTHLPLSDVPRAITKEKIIQITRLLNQELKNRFSLPHPHILVCGLNPHAGEMGHLGREEIEIITPALQQLQKEGINVEGPMPADTIFTKKYLENTDVILAMYHDQALPVVKYLGFGHAVNVTLGLPIIRTSVDHGTALDIAGTEAADAGSMMAAVELAIKLCKKQP